MTAQDIINFAVNLDPASAAILAENGRLQISLRPGPLELYLVPSDIAALRLLNRLPDTYTNGQLLDILDQARWWLVFFAALVSDSPTPSTDNLSPKAAP